MKVPAAEKLEIQGVVPQNVLEISESVADRLRKKLLTPVNCGMEFPEQVEASVRRTGKISGHGFLYRWYKGSEKSGLGLEYRGFCSAGNV